MRSAVRNQRKIHYADPIKPTVIEDENDLFTGDYALNYTNPREYRINYNESGQAADAEFGINRQYEMTLVTCDLKCPFTIETVLWIHADPEKDPYDYVVTSVIRSINSVRIRARRVENNA